MKPTRVGIVAAAILLALTGIGFGIAQAEGTHTEQPVLSFSDMENLDNPIETGSLPKSEGIESIVIFGDEVERNLQEGVLAGGP